MFLKEFLILSLFTHNTAEQLHKLPVKKEISQTLIDYSKLSAKDLWAQVIQLSYEYKAEYGTSTFDQFIAGNKSTAQSVYNALKKLTPEPSGPITPERKQKGLEGLATSFNLDTSEAKIKNQLLRAFSVLEETNLATFEADTKKETTAVLQKQYESRIKDPQKLRNLFESLSASDKTKLQQRYDTAQKKIAQFSATIKRIIDERKKPTKPKMSEQQAQTYLHSIEDLKQQTHPEAQQNDVQAIKENIAEFDLSNLSAKTRNSLQAFLDEQEKDEID